MESVKLSVEEQLRLFTCAAYAMSTRAPLWQKGADLCMQYDIESKADGFLRGCETLAYLQNTIDSRDARDLGLDIEKLEINLDKAVEHHIFSEKVKIGMLAKIVASGNLLYKDDINRLLSYDGVRSHIRQEYEEASPDRRENDKGLKRAYDRLRKYEHDQILLGGRDMSDVKLKNDIKTVLGGKMAEAVFEGIAPHKGITKNVDGDLLTAAREMARKKAKRDPLADKQKKLEDGKFIHKVLGRKRQQTK